MDQPRIRHIRVEYRARIIWFVLCAVPYGAFAGVSRAFGVNSVVSTVIGLITFYVTLGLLDMFRTRRIRRRFANLRRDHPASDQKFEEAVVACASGYPSAPAMVGSSMRSSGGATRIVAEEALRAGCDGAAFQIADNPEEFKPFEPFPDPFEPIPLAALKRVSESLGPESPTGYAAFREHFRHAFRAYGKSRWMRGFFIFSMVVATMVFPLLIYKTVLDLLQHRKPEFLEPMFGAVPVVIAVFAFRMLGQRQFIAVPSGLLVRGSHGLSSKWSLHLFPRASSVLVYWRELNCLSVAGADGQAFACRVIPKQAEVALRAWISPFPPPMEQLTDLS